MSTADEPLYGFLLVGEYPEQLLYERGDWPEGVAELGEERWFNIADVDDVYTYANLVKDYPIRKWLVSVE